MSKKLTVRKVGGSLMVAIPRQFAEIVEIKEGTKMEMEIIKKDTISLKMCEM